MKRIALLIPLLAWCSPVLAQTNISETTGTTNAEPTAEESVVEESAAEDSAVEEAEPDTGEDAATEALFSDSHIFSDSVVLGIKSRSAIYRGNVRLEDPRLHLTCEQLSADVPEEGGRVQKVVAETNVVIVVVDDNGKTNRAYAEKAVYTYTVNESSTNELVELSGDVQPRIERDDVIFFGDVIVWDRLKGEINAVNQRTIPRRKPEDLQDTPETNAVGDMPQGEAGDPDDPASPSTDE